MKTAVWDKFPYGSCFANSSVTEVNLLNLDILLQYFMAYLINTARGEIVDQIALRKAIISGQISGAGLDTLDPEPVTVDNPLVDLPEAYRNKVLLAPHLGGITTGSFKRMHRHIWQNVQRIADGELPNCIVN